MSMVEERRQERSEPDAERQVPKPGEQPEPQPATASEQVELFTDAKSGLWAGVTTAFCVGIVAVGNLMLLAAALGHDTHPELFPDIVGWVIGAGFATAVVVALTWLVMPGKRNGRAAAKLGFATGTATALLVALLFGIARLSASGRSLAWQPIVGLSLSVVAVAAFGGFYLASRRARIGFAASFVLTFLVLLSYMLTLDGLAAAADGRSSGSAEEDFTAAAGAIRDLLTDFRGSVALIVGFYFGTDAAVSVVKIFRTSGGNAQEIARLDRDLAVPTPR